MSEMTIGGLANAGGVGVETIRYYQRRGLLKTPKRAQTGSHSGSIRRYSSGDVHRLRFIRSAQAAGFTLDQIAELIRLDARDDRPRARELAAERIAALDVEIARLKTARKALSHLAHECASTTAGPCPILTAFDKGRGHERVS